VVITFQFEREPPPPPNIIKNEIVNRINLENSRINGYERNVQILYIPSLMGFTLSLRMSETTIIATRSRDSAQTIRKQVSSKLRTFLRFLTIFNLDRIPLIDLSCNVLPEYGYSPISGFLILCIYIHDSIISSPVPSVLVQLYAIPLLEILMATVIHE